MLKLCLACLAATAAGLHFTPASVLSSSAAGHGRSTKLVAQLAPDWVTGRDDATGQTYYFNEQTGHAQWEPPPGWATGVDEVSLKRSAQQGYDPLGRLDAAQAVWVLAPSDTVLHEYTLRSDDEQVLGRADMVKQNSFVSRTQCLVRVAADGSASVESVGKAQVYIFTESEMPPPGEMIDHAVVFDTATEKATVLHTVVLRTGQVHPLQDRDQIVFRQAKFTVYAEQGTESGWVMGVDEQSGQTYYYNEQTGESQWEPPPAGGDHVTSGWVTGVDAASGQTYYYNEQTGKSQWEPPQ